LICGGNNEVDGKLRRENAFEEPWRANEERGGKNDL
jgi:hypothetical protein